jgi:D-alanyl-D-alanine endopeptidase (penicillin-binding protein 7)
VIFPGSRRFLFAATIAAALGAPAAAPAQGSSAAKARPGSQVALRSSSALVLDQSSGEVIYGKNTQAVVPIASITKLMTAMVVLDAQLDADEPIAVTAEDVDWLRGSTSRLKVGTVLTRDQLLRLALMASENRAAAALSRAYPGGRPAFVAAMNEKAHNLGLEGTYFSDPTGLSSANVSTAEDLATLVAGAHTYPKIREYSTLRGLDMQVGKRIIAFHNTNRLVANPGWDIGLSKTGYISEAGRCLVMQVQLAGRAVIIVLLDSWGKYSRLADASRLRQWIEAVAAPRQPGINPASHRARDLSASRRSSAAAM